MKKLILSLIVVVLFVACSSEDENSCECVKSYYKFDNPSQPGELVNSNVIDCTDEVEKQFIDADTYFTIECN